MFLNLTKYCKKKFKNKIILSQIKTSCRPGLQKKKGFTVRLGANRKLSEDVCATKIYVNIKYNNIFF